MVDGWNRDVGFTYKPRKATVAPIIRGQDDGRSVGLRNAAIQRANEVRERRATWENSDWLLAQSPETWKNTEFLSKANPVLSKLKANQDFWTTDQDESRNMYQMAINNMYGGKGARMLDLRGLPSAVQADPNKYRYGRTLFNDPSKSQGFFEDLGSLLTGKNKAAVRATEYNPLHEEGYGRDWYIDKFGQPWGDKLEGLMKLALPGPLKFMAGKEREPLPSDRSWIPENVGAYNEIPEIPFMGDEPITFLPQEEYKGSGMKTDPFYEYEGESSGSPFGTMDITDAVVGDGPDIAEAYELEKEKLSKEEPSKYPLGNIGSIFEGEDYSPDFDKYINKIQDSVSREAAKNAALAFQMYYKESQDKFDPKFEELYQVYADAIIQGRLVDAGILEPQ